MPKILIVDDDINVLEMMRDYLSNKGSELLCAENAQEGWRFAFQEKPNLVLLDLGLPDLPGEELLKQIKQFLPHTKVIVVTGQSDENLRQRMMNLGSDAYFDKGETSLSQIERKIRKLLS